MSEPPPGRGAARQIVAASALVGDQVQDLVVLQHRKPSFWWWRIGLMVPAIALVFQQELAGDASSGLSIWGGVALGVAFGLPLIVANDVHGLASSPRGLTLLAMSRWSSRPTGVLGSVAADAVEVAPSGVLYVPVTLDGRRYLAPRTGTTLVRLRHMLEVARGPAH